MRMSEYPPIKTGDMVGPYIVHSIWSNHVLILDLDENMHTISYKELCSIRERIRKKPSAIRCVDRAVSVI